MKLLILIGLCFLLTTITYADTYVVVSGDEALGAVRVSDKSLPDWQARYLMIREGDE